MSDETKTCPKCGGEMLEGSVVDRSGFAGTKAVASWIPGKPKKSFFERIGAAPIESETLLDAYCCSSCGYVELFAVSPPRRN